MARPHVALRENPPYFDMLRRLDNVACDAVAPAIKEEEIARIHQTPLFATDVNDFLDVKSAAATDALSLSENVRHIVGGELLATFGKDFRTHRLVREGVNEVFGKIGTSVRLVDDHRVLLSTNQKQTFLWPNFEQGVVYWAANAIIVRRLRSQQTQLNAWLAVGGETGAPIDKLIRVMKRPYGTQPMPYAIESFVEGYDSVLFAGYHLEQGGARGITQSAAFAQAINSYTNSIPKSGLLAPLAMRGEYFQDLVDMNGNLMPGYVDAFGELRERSRSAGPPYRPLPEDDEILAYYASLDEESLLRLSLEEREWVNQRGLPLVEHDTDPQPPYQNEGCPATYHKIVHHAAQLFQATVRQLSPADMPQPQQLDVNGLHDCIAARRAEGWGIPPR